MITYDNDDISTNETETDYGKLGVVDMKRMSNALPFYSFTRWNIQLKREKAWECEDSGGDCFEHLKKYLDM